MLDYASLFALATVVREGSFERAARVLHVTPSAVSQRIRLLEDRMGCALVVRGQPCQATQTGLRLCQHMNRVHLLEHELDDILPPSSPPVRAQVPVAVNADSLATWFLPAMTAFAGATTALLQLSVDDESHTDEWLRTGAVLAAVTASAGPIAGYNCTPLGTLRYVAAASPALRDRYFSEGVSIEQLAGAPSLMFNAKDRLQQRWVATVFGQEVNLPRHALPSPHAFVAATLVGMGWALHPLALIQDHLRRGELVELQPGTPLDVPLYWQHARIASTLLEELTRAVTQAACDHLG